MGEGRGPREEAVERIVVLVTLEAVGPIENPGGGVEVDEGEIHRLLAPEIQGHLPEDAGGTDLIKSVETSPQTVVVEVVGVNAFPEEQFGIELVKGVVDFVKRASLFAEEIDDQSHDPFAGGKDRPILVPRGLLVNELGNPEVATEGGDQRSCPHGMREKRLDRRTHRDLGKSRTIGNSVTPTFVTSRNFSKAFFSFGKAEDFF